MDTNERRYEATAGELIDESAARMVALADAAGVPVVCDFNGLHLTARPGDRPEDVTGYYHNELDRRRAAYEASPEGKAAAVRRAEQQRIADAAARDPLGGFTLRDPESWDKSVATNSGDDYGAGILRYASRWARAMEAKMSAGATLADCADATSHEADSEGITGFMYGCAVNILGTVWAHGDALRAWHNRKYMPAEKADAAAADGRTVNPAILTVGPQTN